jgi:hypothetical protein
MRHFSHTRLSDAARERAEAMWSTWQSPKNPALSPARVAAGAARWRRVEGGRGGLLCAQVGNKLLHCLWVLHVDAVAIRCATCNSVWSQMRRTVPLDHFRLSAVVVPCFVAHLAPLC